MNSKKEYGHFDDKNREYVITNPKTPFPWINYLGNEDFFGLISNTGGGYNFYKDAKFRRITRYRYNSVPMDSVGRYFYIVERQKTASLKEESVIWNPGWKPCKTALDSYECRHGLNYTRITGAKNKVRASVLYFVPLGVKAEIQRLTLTNESAETKRLKLFSYAEWCLWNAATDGENFQRNLSTGEVEIERVTGDGLQVTGFTAIYHKTEYKERRNHYAYYSVNCAVNGYDTDRESFVGLYNDLSEPSAVSRQHSEDSLAHGWSPIASHYIEVELKAGESRDFIFVLGYEENEPEQKFLNDENDENDGNDGNDGNDVLITSLGEKDHHIINKTRAHEVIERFATVEAVDAAFAELNALWDELLSKFHVESSDEQMNRMVNIWNQYQCMITFCMSRSASFFESGVGRGMGFRDSNQDLVGFVHQIPSRARQRIIDIASTQFPDGGCYHQYQPLTKRGNNDIGGGFNDDPMWLIFGTTAYIRETGDYSILDEMVPWDNEPGTEVSLLEHLRISFNHVVNNVGPHGLPLIGRADWNDCLNLNCFSNDPNESFQTTGNKTEGSKAESLMIAGLFVYCGRQFVELLKVRGLEVRGLEDAIDAMCKAVEQYGWDGEWYLRAYDYYGNKVGSHENEEGKIFIESQGWCGMARIGAELGMPEKALDSAAKLLDSEHGMVLNWPAYTTYHIELGEQSTYPAGYKENGGIFCHNNPWVIIAMTEAGRGNDAWTLYKKIAPAWIKDQDLHKVEPYVYCQMVAGKEAAKPGEGKNSWLTGTAAWNWLVISQHILGIQPTYEGLRIKPCIPSDLKEYTVTRKWREAEYVITVKNPNGKQTLDEPVVLPYEPGKHEVTIVL